MQRWDFDSLEAQLWLEGRLIQGRCGGWVGWEGGAHSRPSLRSRNAGVHGAAGKIPSQPTSQALSPS